MGMESMGSGLATRIITISDIKRAFAPSELPVSIPELPCALVVPADTLYNQTFGNAEVIQFRVVILASSADQPGQLNRLIDYIDKSGDDSVYAAIAGDATLGGAADFTMLMSNTGIGTTQWGGHHFLSTEFLVECQKA